MLKKQHKKHVHLKWKIKTLNLKKAEGQKSNKFLISLSWHLQGSRPKNVHSQRTCPLGGGGPCPLRKCKFLWMAGNMFAEIVIFLDGSFGPTID